eukprot:8714032-Pyramimonas_sp.AAC.1
MFIFQRGLTSGYFTLDLQDGLRGLYVLVFHTTYDLPGLHIGQLGGLGGIPRSRHSIGGEPGSPTHGPFSSG